MTYNLFCSAYGDVRVSPYEMRILDGAFRIEQEIDRTGWYGRVPRSPTPYEQTVIAKSEAIIDACNRFAKHKYGARP